MHNIPNIEYAMCDMRRTVREQYLGDKGRKGNGHKPVLKSWGLEGRKRGPCKMHVPY